jgi:hypothetical protein
MTDGVVPADKFKSERLPAFWRLVTNQSAYLETNKPVVKAQLQKAGVRLARLLDVAFGN